MALPTGPVNSKISSTVKAPSAMGALNSIASDEIGPCTVAGTLVRTWAPNPPSDRASSAFSRPPVAQSPFSSGTGSTELKIRRRSCEPLTWGANDLMSEATPATWGAAKEVPLAIVVPFCGEIPNVTMFKPGAKRSTEVAP